jgi:transketolase
MTDEALDTIGLRRIADTIRMLAVDAVEQAASGHPGMPMGMADAAAVLWTRWLRHDPADPEWPDRDRFVLSAGHGSMLLYALLHLSGYDLPLEQLRRFRQWGSLTPGHPEYGHTPGVETTTGPLGQGFANAVGMAIAERHHASRFNRPGHAVIDHRTFVIASDGDLMEGISHEAASLAGHLGLGRLIVLYDDNRISIDGATSLSFTEDVTARFAAYGWHVQSVDGHDPGAVDDALRSATTDEARPSLIACRTIIGFGAPTLAGSAETHGAPLGAAEAAGVQRELGWPNEPFHVPSDVLDYSATALARGRAWREEWERRLREYAERYPAAAAALTRALTGSLPESWEDLFDTLNMDKPLATRAASGAVLDTIAPHLPELAGGSADLTTSNNTRPAGAQAMKRHDFAGRYVHFGVREHAMGAVLNGMALHGGVIPYGGTFLVFSDYMRPAIRLAALMGLRVVYVFTHDSVALGEDGPTHQPIEHVSSLRLIPNLVTIRPADAAETAEAWRVALSRMRGPTALVLTRQKVAALPRGSGQYAPATGVRRGGYVLVDAPAPYVILIATGSEVQLALAAQKALALEGVRARVVSMPSLELFEQQPEDYRNSVLPARVRARVAIEAGTTRLWRSVVGEFGEVVGIDRFGASAPGEVVYEKLGLTVAEVARAAQRSLQRVQTDGNHIVPVALWACD